MKVVQLHELTPKQCLSPSPTPKISQKQMSELKETKKMKVVQLHE